jgi:tetratricopeptide (TPR) repeat protein
MLGQPAKAVADFTRAIDLNPKLALAWDNRGLAHGHLGQWDKAVADHARAIELNPKAARAWNNRGKAYRNLRQPAKAVADYSRAIELDPQDAKVWCNRGNAYSDLGQLDRAVADYSRAIELNPKHAGAYLLRAQTYCRMARFAQAREDYQTLLKLAPADAQAHNDLAWLLATCPDAKVRDPQQAVKLATRAVQLAPKEGGFWNTLGVAHYRAGDWKAAVAALGKSVELGKGGNACDFFFLAMAHRKLGNHNEARKAYDQALGWLEKNTVALEKDSAQAEELRRFRSEAEEVLELKKK